jgi:hypothetical protein
MRKTCICFKCVSNCGPGGKNLSKSAWYVHLRKESCRENPQPYAVVYANKRKLEWDCRNRSLTADIPSPAIPPPSSHSSHTRSPTPFATTGPSDAGTETIVFEVEGTPEIEDAPETENTPFPFNGMPEIMDLGADEEDIDADKEDAYQEVCSLCYNQVCHLIHSCRHLIQTMTSNSQTNNIQLKMRWKKLLL